MKNNHILTSIRKAADVGGGGCQVLNSGPLLCLAAVTLLAQPPEMLDSYLGNSLNDPTLNRVSLEL